MLASEDLSKFTVVQLKEKLRAAGLPVSGRKAELIERVMTAPPGIERPATPAPRSAWTPTPESDAEALPGVVASSAPTADSVGARSVWTPTSDGDLEAFTEPVVIEDGVEVRAPRSA